MTEFDYENGRKQALISMIQHCMKELGHDLDNNTSQLLGLLKEREDAIIRLRELCRKYGDNEWLDDLYLSDIIDKHLTLYILKMDQDSSKHMNRISDLEHKCDVLTQKIDKDLYQAGKKTDEMIRELTVLSHLGHCYYGPAIKEIIDRYQSAMET